MPRITSTELGATGRYVNLGSPASQDNVGAETWMAYCRPTGSGGGGFAYIFGKVPSGTTTGPRFFITHNGGSPVLQLGYSAGAGLQVAAAQSTAGLITYGNWHHFEGTWDGTIAANTIKVFVDGAAANTESEAGTTAVSSDAANDLFLINRGNAGTLGRAFVGDFAYAARWNRVLTAAERAHARFHGPLSVPSGLILLWANDQDYSSSALTAAARSTRVEGALPPNTNLSGLLLVPAALTYTGATPTLRQEPADGIYAFVPATLTYTGATPELAPQFTIRDDYERSSVNVAASSIVGAGDDAIITLRPRLQESQIVSSQTRWLEPSARVDGVNGFRPTFRFDLYVIDGNGGLHGSWPSTRRAKFSYDRLTWFDFDTTTPSTANDWIEFRHGTPFTQSTVYISRSRQTSVTQTGQWLADTAAASGGVMVPAASAVAYTPGSGVAGYPAQTFIADEFAAQIDELGRTIPSTPFYAAEINDTSLMPTDGSAKRLAIITTGCHCGEDHGDFVSRGFITALLGDTAEAQAVRRRYRVLVYPMINAPGRCGGGWRGSFTQGAGGADDANRNFDRSDSLLEIVDIPKAAITSDRASVVPDWTIDFHSMRLETWGAYFRNAGLIEEFSDRITAETGDFVDDRGSLASSSISGYFESLGVPMAVTHESGDPAPVSDADITDHTAGMVRALESMMADGLFGEPVDLAGAAIAGASAAGGLSVSVPLSGAATSGALAAGQLMLGVGLQGDAFASALATAQISQGVALAGGATGSGQAAATLVLALNLSGAAVATAQAQGELQVDVPLSGAAAASAQAEAELLLAKRLAAAAIASAQASAALEGGAALQGDATAGALASGALDKAVALAANAQAGALASGALQGAAQLEGAATGGASGSAMLLLRVDLSAAAVASALASGSLQIAVNLQAAAVARALAGASLTVNVQVLLQGAAVAGASGAGLLAGTVAGPRVRQLRFGLAQRRAVVRSAARTATFELH